jgi:SAM-dependent methyltransferase
VPAPRSIEARVKRLVYETYHAPPAERSATAARWWWALRVLLWPVRNHSVLSFPPPATRHVFEFGAGSGNDLLEFRAAGWTVGGCEPSAHACDVAARSGITLQNCNAEAAEVPDGTSCIYMNNVFEHLHDPIAVLANARPRLASDGLVVLVVPNHGSMASALFGAAWPGYDPPKHIWGYTRASLPGILAQAGYDTIAIDQKYPFSTYCWATGIIGDRLPNPPCGTWRPRLARLLGRSLVLAGMVSAVLGRGDYLRVLARPRGRARS